MAGLRPFERAWAGDTPRRLDRSKGPYTSVVDAHLHFRPFGGRAIPFEEVNGYLAKTGVHHANMFGIGQVLPADSDCTYYLDCPGTPVRPRMRNDFANAESLREFRPTDPSLALSMTFMDLHHPETVPDGIALLDREYPGMFRWAGEVNVVKQALFPNLAEPATSEDIPRWAPFMKVYEDRGIPVTFHSDLGNDAAPTKYLHLMEEILDQYPKRAIPGTDFVAARNKDYAVYEQELEVTSRINVALSVTAFRDIALGQNYFKLLGLKDRAPRICSNGLRPNGMPVPGPLPATAPADDED